MFLFGYFFGHSCQKDGFSLMIQFNSSLIGRNQRKRIVWRQMLISFAADTEISYPFLQHGFSQNLNKIAGAPIDSASIELAIDFRFFYF
jgi:hypothetical protein